MAKGQNVNSKFTGKIGAIVYSVNSGVQVAREYNPIVKNPNTLGQVNQRSRLKLASQLAAALATVIAIPRDGLVTPRNQFIKINMDFITANNGQAQISYENIQLTKGVIGLPGIHAERDGEGYIVIHLDSSAAAAVSRVVYVVYKKTAEDQLQFVDSAVVTEAGDGGTFSTSIVDFEGDVIIWAYGMKDANANASAQYGNYSVATGEDIAQLVMSRNLAAGDYQFTKTRGITLFDNEDQTTNAGENQNMVYITASGPGTVSGEGFTGNRKAVDEGDSVTVVATPNANCEFLGWKLNGSSSYVSTSASYTFTPSSATDLIAVFNDPNSGSGSESENVSLTVAKTEGSDIDAASVSGMVTLSPNNGSVAAGESVTVAQANSELWEQFTFGGAYRDAAKANLISSTLPFNITLTENTTIYLDFTL